MHSGICASSMHTIYLIIVFLLLTSSLKAQHIDTDTLHSDESFEHTEVKRIAGDSLSTSFIIWEKKKSDHTNTNSTAKVSSSWKVLPK